MNHIFADLLQRLTKEVKVTAAGMRESVLAISERVNRKTQTLRLHWQAATLAHQMEHVFRTVGQTLCDLAAPSNSFTGTMPTTTHMAANTRLLEGATAARALKQELMQVEELIRELEVEALHEDFIKIQRDLINRSAGLARLVITSDSSAVGLSLTQLNLPETTRAAALLRGPTLLSPTAEVLIRAGDIIILIGPQVKLQEVAARFVGRRHSESSRVRVKSSEII